MSTHISASLHFMLCRVFLCTFSTPCNFQCVQNHKKLENAQMNFFFVFIFHFLTLSMNFFHVSIFFYFIRNFSSSLFMHFRFPGVLIFFLLFIHANSCLTEFRGTNSSSRWEKETTTTMMRRENLCSTLFLSFSLPPPTIQKLENTEFLLV